MTAMRDGQRHRLDLVVGDVDDGLAEALVQLLDLDAHLDAQLGVEVGQRLVEQEHVRLAHQRPADGDALALAAGELARACGRAACSICSSSATLRDRGVSARRAARRASPGRTRCSRARSLSGRARRTGTPWRCRGPWGATSLTMRSPMRMSPSRRVSSPAMQIEQRRLAAARRPEQHQELAVVDLEVDVLEHLDRAEALPDVLEAETWPWPLSLDGAGGEAAHEILAGEDIDDKRRQGRR